MPRVERVFQILKNEASPVPNISRKRSVFLNGRHTPRGVSKHLHTGNRVSQSPLHAKEAFADTEHGIAEDIIYENIKPVLNILRLMGVFPVTRPFPGHTLFRVVSPVMAYSAILYAFAFTYVGYVFHYRVRVTRSDRFEDAVVAYIFVVNCFPIVFGPILWYETTKIAALCNRWTDFEIRYKNVTGRALPLNMTQKSLLIAISVPLLSTAGAFLTHITMVDFRLLQVIPYCYLDTLTYMMGAYWYLMCEVLSGSAIILADDFKQALRHIGPAAVVAEYRALWLQLSKLTRDTGTTTCYVFTGMILQLFIVITLSIYGLMSQLSDGFGIKDVGLAVTAFCSVGLLFEICDEAHNASQNVRTNFQKKLLMVELSWINSHAQTEINMFLRATEMNPSNISLGGFLDVNRNLFKSLLATMVTYLVVLLQFQISIPDATSSPNNTAFNYTLDAT